MLFLELNAPDQILETINFQVRLLTSSPSASTSSLYNFPHVLNLLMIGVDRLLQHALHSPPSQGGELQPNYVDHVPHHSSYHLVHSVVPFEVTMILTGSRICLRLVGDCLS